MKEEKIQEKLKSKSNVSFYPDYSKLIFMKIEFLRFFFKQITQFPLGMSVAVKLFKLFFRLEFWRSLPSFECFFLIFRCALLHIVIFVHSNCRFIHFDQLYFDVMCIELNQIFVFCFVRFNFHQFQYLIENFIKRFISDWLELCYATYII